MSKTTKRSSKKPGSVTSPPCGSQGRLVDTIIEPAALELLRAIDIPDPGAARILETAISSDGGWVLEGNGRDMRDLAGWVAGEANHCRQRRRAEILHEACDAIEAALVSIRRKPDSSKSAPPWITIGGHRLDQVPITRTEYFVAGKVQSVGTMHYPVHRIQSVLDGDRLTISMPERLALRLYHRGIVKQEDSFEVQVQGVTSGLYVLEDLVITDDSGAERESVRLVLRAVTPRMIPGPRG